MTVKVRIKRSVNINSLAPGRCGSNSKRVKPENMLRIKFISNARDSVLVRIL